jgi:hypothetical protein
MLPFLFWRVLTVSFIMQKTTTAFSDNGLAQVIPDTAALSRRLRGL